MQLLARDSSRTLSALQAEKGKEYHCPECGLPLRLRRGTHRQAHFYHTSMQVKCRQHQKSLEHLQLQLKLLALFGEDAAMECPFPAINRIADVAWHAQKYIFEIQYSPISLEEAKGRTADYARAGYTVIWILHDKRFNKKTLSASEAFLRNHPCYFTNSDHRGEGILYDQFEVFREGRRIFKGPPLAVDLTHLKKGNISTTENAPKAIQSRIENWGLHAKGDLFSRYIEKQHASSFAQMARIEERLLQTKNTRERLKTTELLRALYRQLLHFLLSITARVK